MSALVADARPLERLEAMAPGEVARVALNAGTLASGLGVELPVLLRRGASARPRLWVNATVHGNESTATIAALALFRALDGVPLRGSVVVTPVANPVAFDARAKHAPLDGIDLDQSFAPRATGFSTERLARTLLDELLDGSGAVLNLHTMAPFLDAVLYAVHKQHGDYAVPERELLALIARCAPELVCRMRLDGPGELPGDIAGALDHQAMLRGIPAFMLELGASGGWDEAMTRRAVDGMRAVAAAVGVVDEDAPVPAAPLAHVTERTHVTCNRAGLFRALCRPGQELAPGQPLGEIFDVYGGEPVPIAFERPMRVIGVRRDPVVHTGDRVAFVATRWEPVAVTP